MNQANKIKYRICPQDIILSIIIIAGSFCFLFGFNNNGTSTGSGELVIYQNGKIIKNVSLNHREIIRLPVGRSEISIEVNPEQGVRMLDSSCPAKICVHNGWIRKPSETIICLPNKVLLEIEGENTEYDAISY